MFIRPHTLSLITTHRCTAACDHCCFGCTPDIPMSRSIPVERMRGLIDEAATMPSMKVVVFTGGECFLFGRDLVELVGRATDRGLATRCVTNGYWARTRKAARKRLGELREAGLGELNLSTGSFHARYVPAERIVHAAAVAVELGLGTLVNAEVYAESDFDIDAITEHEELAGHIRSGRLRVQRNVWMTNDWGEQPISHDERASRFREENKTGCDTVLNVLTVTPDQDLVACCGLTQELIPELHLGSVADRSLTEVVERTPDDFLKIWIHVEGPERVLEFVKRHVPDYELPTDSVHPCQTCLHLHRDETARRVLREHYRSEEDRVTDLYLAGIASQGVSNRTLPAFSTAEN